MTEGYYDPHPRLALKEPLVLVGHPGSGVAHAGRVISGRTGLPFNDVERSAEALAGSSRARVLFEQGRSALRRLESEALRKSIRRRPCGVVVIRSGSLEDDEDRRWLGDRCCLLYLRRPDEVLLRRIRSQVEASPGSLAEFIAGAPACAQELRRHLEPWEAGLRDVDAIIEAGDRHATAIAAEILAGLDRLLSVRRLR